MADAGHDCVVIDDAPVPATVSTVVDAELVPLVGKRSVEG